MGDVREEDCSDYTTYQNEYENNIGTEYTYTVYED
jgi:hypothetical protein